MTLNRIRVALIIPSLSNKGPIRVVYNLVNALSKHSQKISLTIFYFDNVIELIPNCKYQPIQEINLEDFDIIHTHGIRPDWFAFKNKRRIKRHMVTIHNFVFDDLKYSYNRIISLIFGNLWVGTWKRSDMAVTLTQTMKEYYTRFLGEKKLEFAYNGIPRLEHSVLSSLEKDQINNFKSNRAITIGSICAVTKTKGIDQIVRLLQRDSNLGFILIGDGKDLPDLKKLAHNLNVYSQCLFLGYKKNIHQYLPYFDVFAMPSRSEGFGLSLIEAAQFKLPTLCSDIPTFREMFSSNEVAFFELENLDSLEDSLKYLLEHKNKISEKFYAKYAAKYTDFHLMQRYEQLYLKLYNT